MNILDIIILLCFIPALIQGIRQGFISQATSIVAIIAGVWMSFKFANTVSDWISGWFDGSEQYAKIIAFAVILIVVIIGLNLLGKMLEQIVKVILLGWLDKLLGVIFAFAKCWLIIGVIILLFSSLNDIFSLVPEEKLAESMLYAPLKSTIDTVFPYLRDLVQK